MYPMMSCLQIKARAGLHKMFKEECGASGTIEAVIMIGIVVVVAFLFRTAIFDLFSGLWDGLVRTPAGNGGTATGEVTVNSIPIPS